MAPAGRALALATAIAVAAAGGGPTLRAGARAGAGDARPADHPRHRDREFAARLCDADPEGGGPCPAERPRRHPQRPRLQRLRHGRPPHLHQCRRAVRRQDAERNHRRVRARDRPPCRRPSDAAAREARPGADRVDRRIAGRRRRRGRRRALRRRRQYRRRRDHGAAIGDPALAARLCAHPGRPGRPCRREIPHRHRPVGQGHARTVQAPEQRNAVQFAPSRSLSANPPDAARARRRARGRWPRRAPIGTSKIRPNCSCATT